MFLPRFAKQLLTVVILLSPGFAAAWWDGGHKIVAQIAFDELSPAERAWVIDLLKANPTHEELFLAKLQAELGHTVPTETKTRWYFSQAAIWADLVREKKGHARAEEIRANYNREARHYTDAPIFARPSDEAALPHHASKPSIAWSSELAEPEEGFNSLQTLTKACAEIPDPSLPSEQRSLSLLWLFHLVGDMHQPCHCAQLFVLPSLPEGDRGANQIFVFGLKSQNPGAYSDALHAFWDGQFNGESNTHADILERTAQAKARTVEWQRALGLAQITDPAIWWEEGIALAKSAVYAPLLTQIVEAEGQPHPFGGDRPDIIQIRLAPPAFKAYVAQARATGQQQILTAGLRLAAVLKELHRRSVDAKPVK